MTSTTAYLYHLSITKEM